MLEAHAEALQIRFADAVWERLTEKLGKHYCGSPLIRAGLALFLNPQI